MIRRQLSVAVLVWLATGLTAFALAADKMKVVYHVSEADKVAFAMNNIRNHIKGVGGPDKVEIVLVVHGPGLKALHDIEATDKVRSLLTELQNDKVQFNACGNTMRAQDVELDDLLPGFVRVDQGGVVRIAELQMQGYVYIRP